MVALRARMLAGFLAAGAACAALAGCGGSTPKAPPVATLLTRARTVVNGTRAVHFVLASSGVAHDGVQLAAGNGDLARPDLLRGTFTLEFHGVPIAADVVSIGGAFYIRIPPAPFARADPSKYSFGNPAELISPTKGVSALLADMAGSARADGQERVDGELLDRVAGNIPGAKVPVLPDAEPSVPVHMVVAIDPSSDQVRLVTLAGPFTAAHATTTYTVTLTHYGEHLSVTAPGT